MIIQSKVAGQNYLGRIETPCNFTEGVVCRYHESSLFESKVKSTTTGPPQPHRGSSPEVSSKDMIAGGFY